MFILRGLRTSGRLRAEPSHQHVSSDRGAVARLGRMRESPGRKRKVETMLDDAVAVKPDVDHDGDAILRVTVVVQDGTERLDPKKVLDASGSIWSELDEAGIESFPIVSYMTKSDAARVNPEPVWP